MRLIDVTSMKTICYFSRRKMNISEAPEETLEDLVYVD